MATAPVRYDVGQDILYICVTPDEEKLSVVSNSNSAVGKSLFWWAYTQVPLKMDGQSHEIILDSKLNPQFHSETSFLDIHFQDGTLYYSAFETTGSVFKTPGEKLIAFHLATGGLPENYNGDGIYYIKNILGDYNQYAHSAQNNFWPSIEAALGLAGSIFAGNSPIGAASAKLLMQGIAKAGNESYPTTKAQYQSIATKIATKGWNTYAANYSPPVESSNPTTTFGIPTPLLVLLGAAVLFFVLKRK